MQSVELKPLFHKNKDCIGIYSDYNADFNQVFIKEAGAAWSKTNQCWYIPCTRNHYDVLFKSLSGKAVLNTAPLKSYLVAKKNDN